MDIQLHYTEVGTGDPLILLHGNNEDSSYFVHQIEYFKSDYRVIAIDTRGHGKSPRGDAPFTIRQFADDLYVFMVEMGIETAHILGFSDGGNIALCFALKYPERVKSLILNGANLDPKGVRFFDQFPVEVGYRFAKIFVKRSVQQLKKTEMLGLMVNDPYIDSAELSAIDVPALVIVGQKDMIRSDHSLLISQSLPKGEFVIIDGDHFCALNNPKQFNEETRKFLLKI